MRDLTGAPVIVVGASRGFGRAVATALAAEGTPVVAVARTGSALAALADEASGSITPEALDALAPEVPGALIDRYAPHTIVLVAGAVPHVAPLHEQTWDTFSRNWETDVHLTFNWLREALVRPLSPGGRVIVFSSGAALAGSPLSGGYAGAKGTQRIITRYAAEESQRAGLGLTFTSVLPRITPLTSVGKPGVVAYAARAGITEEDYLAKQGPSLTPEAVGAAVLQLAQTHDADLASAYRLSSPGLDPLD
jgi:NAD(P)-dependent dehydrogenase (short-subunit alcohol dehydrogenase family)